VTVGGVSHDVAPVGIQSGRAHQAWRACARRLSAATLSHARNRFGCAGKRVTLPRSLSGAVRCPRSKAQFETACARGRVFGPRRQTDGRRREMIRRLNQQSPPGWISGTFSGGVKGGQTDAIPALRPPRGAARRAGGWPARRQRLFHRKERAGGGQRATCALSAGGEGPGEKRATTRSPWHARGRNRLALRTQAKTWNSI
jgi:hypothetical protein